MHVYPLIIDGTVHRADGYMLTHCGLDVRQISTDRIRLTGSSRIFCAQCFPPASPETKGVQYRYDTATNTAAPAEGARMAYDPVEPPDQCGMWGVYDHAREEWCLCASTAWIGDPAQGDQRRSFCGRVIVSGSAGVRPGDRKVLVVTPRPLDLSKETPICSGCSDAVTALASIMVRTGKHVPGTSLGPDLPKGVTSRPAGAKP